ncbi:unnamed protein product, partial [Rangifer tarandus platyrhynchus]
MNEWRNSPPFALRRPFLCSSGPRAFQSVKIPQGKRSYRLSNRPPLLDEVTAVWCWRPVRSKLSQRSVRVQPCRPEERLWEQRASVLTSSS